MIREKINHPNSNEVESIRKEHISIFGVNLENEVIDHHARI
jgi:hypothetical protein